MAEAEVQGAMGIHMLALRPLHALHTLWMAHGAWHNPLMRLWLQHCAVGKNDPANSLYMLRSDAA